MATANYGWILPTVGGSNNAWGTILNDALTEVDVDLYAVSGVANAALPKAGGTLTGNVLNKTDSYTLVNKGNLSGAVEFDLAAGNYFYGTITGAVTSVSFANVPANGVFFVIELTNPGAYAITWPGAVKWPGGSAPSFTAAGVDVIAGVTRDGGTTVRLARVQADSK